MFSLFRIKSCLSTLLLLNCLLVSPLVYAQWWNPFAPKDFDDCMIKNLKSGMSEEAVRALRYSCIRKYPLEKTAAETIAEKKVAEQYKTEEIKLAEKYKKCKINKDHYKKQMFISLESQGSNKTTELISRIENIKYDGSANKVGFQNKNSFGISGVIVGFTTNKLCSLTMKEYQFTTYCTSYSTESGVVGNAYGSLSCGELPKEAKALGFCIIGYSPMYDQFNESLLDFLEKNNYCN